MSVSSRHNERDAVAGSQWSRGYDYTDAVTGLPLDLSTYTFVLTIRPSVADAAQPPLIRVTSAGETPQGRIDVSGGQVSVFVYGAATTLLGQGSYAYALWSEPSVSGTEADVYGVFYSSLVSAP